MRKISYITAVMGATLLVVFASTTVFADEQSFNASYEAAEAARKKAASMNYEWRDTGKLLKQAKKAAGKGDYKTAEKLANKAKMQGEMAVAQAKEQEQLWQSAVVK